MSMESLFRVIQLGKCLGVTPVRKVVHPRKGVCYEQSREWLVMVILHLVNIAMMVYTLEWYINYKAYYHPIRLFQVTVLMYIEIGQTGTALFCSIMFRLRHLRLASLINQCLDVSRDLEGTSVPWLVRNSGPVALILHTLLTLYRTRGSTIRPKMMIFFWIGISYEIMVKILMLTSFYLVYLSFNEVDKELKLVLTHRLRDNSEFFNTLMNRIREKYSRAVRLRTTAEEMFGPDMLCTSFFFVFKISFQCYHMYFKQNLVSLGQNSLVGEFSGFFIAAKLLVTMYSLISVCENISTKRNEIYVSLMYILKSRIERNDEDTKNLVKAFLLQVKSRKNEFDVCKHFVFNKELFYNMILEAVTYVYMLIQLHGLAA